MIQNNKHRFFPRLTGLSLLFALFGLFSACLATDANAQAKGPRKSGNAFSEPATTQQPPFSAYKGVRIGTSKEEARSKLGPATQELEGEDLYVVSQTETAQVYYEAGRVSAISIDYLGANSGAPDYKVIVGDDIQVKPDGSMYKMVRYEQLGFWVSFSRNSGELGITTVTIQKLP